MQCIPPAAVISTKHDMTWQFYVDIVGGCNLACPSCPIGNSRDVPVARGVMPVELLDRIVQKALRECRLVDFGLYNWTEPFLHPDLPAMIRTVRRHGVACSLSTNLNLLRNADAVLNECPTRIKISLSGFDEAHYSHTHRHGDISRVKSNMAELAAARDRTKSATRIVVGYHRYLGNHDDEARMRDYATSLGFEFEPQWAYLMPLEKVLSFADPETAAVPLTPDDRDLIERLALPLPQVLESSRRLPPAPCQLRDRQMSLNVLGNVMLCCVVYDQERYGLGSYLEHSLEELQRRKYSHWQCGPCMRQGLHQFFTYENPELDRIALEHVQSRYPEADLKVLPRPVNDARPRWRRIASRLRTLLRDTLRLP